VAIGIICGLIAAVCYTLANIALRSATHLDPVWVSAVKALPTLLVVLPLVGLRVARAQQVAISRRQLGAVIATGMVAQIFGNVGFQWALGILGMAISVPLVLGAMLISGAVIGRVMLGEPARLQTLLAIAVLLAAVLALTTGAERTRSPRPLDSLSGAVAAPSATHSGAASHNRTSQGVTSQGVGPVGTGSGGQPAGGSRFLIPLAVLANLASGFAYALQGSVMRRVMKGGLPVESLLLILSLVGIGLLGSWTFSRHGWQIVTQTTSGDWWVMLAAGVANAGAFFLLANSLRRIHVLHVQLLNATQTALAALAGWLLFAETLGGWTQLGLWLTAAGLLIAGAPRRAAVSVQEVG
jgi:drug/metabolite transporter, DME family